MATVEAVSNYNQAGSRERSVKMLASAVSRLVNRCECMDGEMRLRFLARLLENLVDSEDIKQTSSSFSLQAVITAHPDQPERAVSEAAALLANHLRTEQGLDDQWAIRFYDTLFGMLMPGQLSVQAA